MARLAAAGVGSRNDMLTLIGQCQVGLFHSTECQMILSHGTAHRPWMAISLKREIEIWSCQGILGLDNKANGRMTSSLRKDFFENRQATALQHKYRCCIDNFFLDSLIQQNCVYFQQLIFDTSYPCFLSQSGDCTKLASLAMRDLTE